MSEAVQGADTTEVARKHIRGSSLLLGGRAVSIGAKFIVQLLIVRHLTTSDFGAWAYALSVVALLGGFASLSLNRSVTRFLAIFNQQANHRRFFGLILLMSGVILATGVVFTVGLYRFPDVLLRLINGEQQPLTLLFFLIFLVPLEALDALVIALFATFDRARPIFVRRYLFAPGLQLAVVLGMIGMGAGPVFLAVGYLAATGLGVLIYGFLALRVLREEGVLARLSEQGVEVPAGEVISFTVPLMTSDWLSGLMGASGVLLLGYFYDTEQIALFKAVVPVAVMNLVVMQSFALLYTPSASRLFADGDLDGINDLYWRTATWIAVLTFPIFALSFFAATPLAVTLFGERYAASGPFLSILAVGYYFQASLGFNGSTLKVLGRLKYLVVINLLAILTNVALAVLLVPSFGALGAAIALSGTLVAHNIFKQTGLRMATGISLLNPRYARCFATLGGGALALVAVRAWAPDSLFVLVPVAALVSFGILALTRGTLRIDQVFPELRRVPILRAVVA